MEAMLDVLIPCAGAVTIAVVLTSSWLAWRARRHPLVLVYLPDGCEIISSGSPKPKTPGPIRDAYAMSLRLGFPVVLNLSGQDLPDSEDTPAIPHGSALALGPSRPINRT